MGQVIEALHRKQNSVKNLTSNIRNEEARMRTVLDNQYQRWIQRASEDEVDGSLLLATCQT